MSKDGVVTAVIPYSPRPIQTFLHKHLKRFNVLVCHRGMGKTVFSEMEIIKNALETPNGIFCFISPYRAQAKRNTWVEFQDLLRGIPNMAFNISELTITFPNGARIFLMGADNYHALRGMHLNGVVLDEVAQMDPAVWTSAVRPTLTNKKGWAIFIGTKNGQDLFYDLYHAAEDKEDWWRVMINVYQSGTLSAEEIESARHEMGQEAFDLEMGDSWTSSLKGSYYLDTINQLEKEGKIREVNWNPQLPVVTAWDLGMADLTCIWFAQVDNGTINIIDYYENSDEILNHYANIILSKPYTYKEHILPHDVYQRSSETGRSRKDVLESLGLRVIVAEKLGKLEGINAVRTLLPRCVFDVASTTKGIKALKHYRTEYDPIRQIYSEEPKKDWSNHASDAFRYLAVMLKTTTYRKPKRSVISTFDPFDYRPDGANWDIFRNDLER